MSEYDERRRGLEIDPETGRIKLTTDLAIDVGAWALSISGKTRDEAVEYLLGMTKKYESDGIVCNMTQAGYYQDSYGFEDYGPMWPIPSGSCMCARLLMMLHDIREEEVSREKFSALMEFILAMEIVKTIEGLRKGEATARDSEQAG